ncbi:MAG TPA: hypothetical protein VK463_06445 [Desulfomonilaceae bacterium]|nr:hypothetical protein [Desulfomonilaceae bacterium]
MDKTDIPIGKIVEDIRLGTGDVLIMEKYQISPKVLVNIKQTLARLSQERQQESDASTEAQGSKKRMAPRNYICYRIRVREAANPDNMGIITDVTNRGLQVQGISSKVGEKLTLLIMAESFHVHSPFAFEATCRWVGQDEDGDTIAGFAITKISGPDFQELRKLIKELTVTDNS